MRAKDDSSKRLLDAPAPSKVVHENPWKEAAFFTDRASNRCLKNGLESTWTSIDLDTLKTFAMPRKTGNRGYTGCKRFALAAALIVALGCLQHLRAGDIKITIPKRSQLTPVQRMNREGVEQINKRHFNKARELFYKAYLFDPGDPFTLNNLGYVAELEGQVERAQAFYAMAAAQSTEARIDKASIKELKGESLASAISTFGDVQMQVNRSNVKAVGLLSEGRIREADTLLQQTLALDPKNAFTLNNVGVAKESQGDYGEALKYYNAAANAHVEDPVIVTMNGSWRGKSVSDMARSSADRLCKRMKTLQNDDAQVTLLNLRGVSAANRNDWRAAQDYFSQAYRLGPDNAFSLNNQGFMAERNGDLESAEDFYRQARAAGGSNDRVGLATRPAAEGAKLSSVADTSDGKVSSAIDLASEARHRQGGPVELKRRDGTTVNSSPDSPQTTPTRPNPEPPQPDNPQQ
jgi:Flp pilus assembly protein TadD